MMEEAVMEAVPEREVGTRRERRMGRECGMRGKWPACKTGAPEMRARPAKARACAHSSKMRPATHSASHGMHSHPATAEAAGMAATAAESSTTSSPRERRGRKRERRTKRTRNETTEKLTTHRIPP